MRTLSFFCMLFLLTAMLPAQSTGGGPGAQEEVLKRDKKALELFEKTTGALYRAREHGLKKVSFHFEVRVNLPDKRKMSYGPFRVDWDASEGHRVSAVGDVKKGQISPEQISSTFLETVVNDVVGWTPTDMVKGRHVALDKKNRVVITPTAKEQKASSVCSIVLQPDKAGRLGVQSVLGQNDYPLMVREYDYVSGSKLILVENVRITSGKTRKIKTHAYQTVGNFTFPERITSYGAEQGTQEVIYSSFLVPAEKPRPAPKKN